MGRIICVRSILERSRGRARFPSTSEVKNRESGDGPGFFHAPLPVDRGTVANRCVFAPSPLSIPSSHRSTSDSDSWSGELHSDSDKISSMSAVKASSEMSTTIPSSSLKSTIGVASSIPLRATADVLPGKESSSSQRPNKGDDERMPTQLWRDQWLTRCRGNQHNTYSQCPHDEFLPLNDSVDEDSNTWER